MEWLEVSVRVVPEAAEAVAEVFSRYSPEGIAIDVGADHKANEPVTVTAYLAVDEHLEEKRRKVREGLGHLSHIWSAIPEPIFTFIEETDWSAKWKERIPVLHLAQNVVIKPSWRSYRPAPGEIVLEMDPGMAFGTGLHPTTRLCVIALGELLQPGMEVLDLGTGTGILAMIAARLGAREIIAVDTDEDAVTAARRNVRANRLGRKIQLMHGSLSDLHHRYHLILANILAPVIIDMVESGLADRLREGGTVVASGILEEQADSVVEALERAGLQMKDYLRQDEWVALVAQRPSRPPEDSALSNLK